MPLLRIRKTISAMLGFVRAQLGPVAALPLVTSRAQTCKNCPATDSAGERLYRIEHGRAFCGVPRARMFFRDDVLDGCGCDLAAKRIKKEASCPLGRW